MPNMRLWNTSVVIDPSTSPDTWSAGVAMALIERVGRNHARDLLKDLRAQGYGSEEFDRIPTGPHYECYQLAPFEFLDMPEVDAYIEDGIGILTRFFTLRDCGVDPEAAMSGTNEEFYEGGLVTPNQLRRERSLAESAMGQIVERCREVWRKRVVDSDRRSDAAERLLGARP